MEIKVLNTEGKETGKKVKLASSVFGIEPNEHAVYLDVRQYLANQRQGTHKAKERAEIKGSTKKLKRQKGTGTARAGSIKSPVFRGGGRVFGPRPRNYGFKLNKKVKQLARRSALSAKAKDNAIIIVDGFTGAFETPKTKKFIEVASNIGADTRKVLYILSNVDKNVSLSSNNIQGAKVVSVNEVCTYDILNAGKLVIAEDSVKEIENILS